MGEVSLKRRAFLLSLAAAATGCVMRRPERENPFERGEGSKTVRVSAVSRNFNQATLYALGPTRRRLGVVPGNGDRSYHLPWPADGNLRVRIDVLAGAEFTTNAVSLQAGDTAHLTIESPLYRSLLRR